MFSSSMKSPLTLSVIEDPNSLLKFGNLFVRPLVPQLVFLLVFIHKLMARLKDLTKNWNQLFVVLQELTKAPGVNSFPGLRMLTIH